ncbi:MAG: hypothetical protein KDD43_09385 [Bdellovibrionales bacterium]|nr:hypothetical protein [Bdellovibrionales bacterium]
MVKLISFVVFLLATEAFGASFVEFNQILGDRFPGLSIDEAGKVVHGAPWQAVKTSDQSEERYTTRRFGFPVLFLRREKSQIQSLDYVIGNTDGSQNSFFSSMKDDSLVYFASCQTPPPTSIPSPSFMETEMTNPTSCTVLTQATCDSITNRLGLKDVSQLPELALMCEKLASVESDNQVQNALRASLDRHREELNTKLATRSVTGAPKKPPAKSLKHDPNFNFILKGCAAFLSKSTTPPNSTSQKTVK